LTDDSLPDWYWRVIVHTDDRGKVIAGAREPHRAAAKQDVQSRIEPGGDTVTEWGRVYIPPASWDCPYCGCSEGLTEQPNCRGDHDWECGNCRIRAYGDPMDWDGFDTSFVRDESLIRTGHLRAEIEGESDA